MKLRSPLPQKKSRLEIIPLIDIMFFLLASFMLVSLTMSKLQSQKVNLPVDAASEKDLKPDMIALAVDASGDYYLGTEKMSLPDLESVLAAKHELNPELPVFISGDENARHGSMIRLLSVAKRLGFKKVAFNTKPPDAAP